METTFFQTRDGNGVVPEVEFGADEKDGGGRGVVADFGDPLRSRVSVNRGQCEGGGGKREGKTYFLFCKMLLTREQIENGDQVDKAGKWSALIVLLHKDVSHDQNASARRLSLVVYDRWVIVTYHVLFLQDPERQISDDLRF